MAFRKPPQPRADREGVFGLDSLQIYTILDIALNVIQIMMILLVAWFGTVFVVSLFRKEREALVSADMNRFGIVICAHNEEAVIANILESIEDQDYPSEGRHVYLLCDHCTDGTARVGRSHPNVTVYERNDGERTGKADVLRWGTRLLLERHSGEFDVFLYFDADNVIGPDFLRLMNDEFNRGNDVVQSNRLAGEPYRTNVTKWYAIYWRMLSFFFERAKHICGFSAIITGTGFAARKEIIEEFGWKTVTITEDVEFTTQLCLKGKRVAFCEEAVCGDEQPSDIRTMFRQMRRWGTGMIQVVQRYSGQWGRAMRKNPTKLLFDNILYDLSVILPIVNLIVMVLRTFLPLIFLGFFEWMPCITFFGMSFAFSWIGAAFMVLYHKLPGREFFSAVLTFPAFPLILIITNLSALIYPSRTWSVIPHRGLERRERPALPDVSSDQ